MAPTLVNSYLVVQSADNTTACTTTAFTPANGEVIVVKALTADGGQTISTPTGGSLVYTSRANIGTASQTCEASIFTAVVGTSPGSMSVSVGFSGSAIWHSILVERWSGAQLDATPAIIQTTQAAGTAPSTTITTEAANSVVSWAIGDWSATSPTGHAYRSSATEEGVHNGSPSQYVGYYAYQAAASVGSQTVGMTAPTQRPSIVGIEVQASGGSTVSGAVSLTATSTLAPSAARTTSGAATLAVTPALSVAGTLTAQALVALASTPTLTANGVRITSGATALAVSPSLSVQPILVAAGAANLAASVSLSVAPTAAGAGANLVVAPGLSVGALLPGGAVALSIASALSAGAKLTEFSSIALSATGVLTADGIRVVAGALSLSIIPTLSALAQLPGGTVSLAAIESLSVAAFVGEFAAISLVAGKTLTVTVSGASGFVSLSVASTLTATVRLDAFGSVSMSAVGVLSLTAAIRAFGVVSLGVLGVLSASGGPIIFGAISLVATEILNVNGIREKPGAANLTSNYILNVNGSLGAFSSAQLNALSTLSVVGRLVAFGLVDLGIAADLAVGLGIISKIGFVALLGSAGLSVSVASEVTASVSLLATALLRFIDVFPEVDFANVIGDWKYIGIHSDYRRPPTRVGVDAWSTGGIHAPSTRAW